MKFGAFEITPFVEQTFRLDGGSMFGVVPRKIWSRLIEPDENNLIPMETNLFLLTAYRKNILLDTGLGDAITDREKKIYAASGKTNIESGLKQIGFEPDDIDVVFLTHLHTDHSGGAVKVEDGRLVPRFRNATYFVQKDEWEDAVNPNERTAAVYIPERMKVLEESGRLQLVDGDAEIFPGIRAVKTGGHTRGHQALEAKSEGILMAYYADIIPSSLHLKIPYVSSTDLYPLDTMDVKKRVIKRLAGANAMIAFDHDLNIKIGRLKDEDGRIVAEKIE